MPTRYPFGPPRGFPDCKPCIYLSAGTSEQCVACASQAITAIGIPSCGICDQVVSPPKPCSNWLCRQPTRHIDRIRSIAVHTGPLRTAILRLKYDGKWGWSIIFGRLLFGYIEKNVDPAEGALIVGNPTHLGTGSRSVVLHTELVLESAEKEDVLGLWRWDVGTPRILRKTGPTPQSAATGFAGKREAAEALSEVLHLTDPDAIAGRRLIVYDDVCTTGLQLNTVAKFLRERGAASVEAIVLARPLWVP